jgi:hypothetical protein
MTVWLARQEAVYRFGTYLQWAVPGYTANSGADSSLDDDEEDEEQTPSAPDPSDADDSDGSDELEDNLSYRVAKTPAFPHVSAATIISEFHATDFLIKLDDFLESQSINSPVQPNLQSTFPVYKRLTVPLPKIPEVSSNAMHDTIRAVRGEPRKMTAKGVKPEKQGQFDPVLIRQTAPDRSQRPTDGTPFYLQFCKTDTQSQAFLLLVYVSSFGYQRISEAIPPHWRTSTGTNHSNLRLKTSECMKFPFLPVTSAKIHRSYPYPVSFGLVI